MKRVLNILASLLFGAALILGGFTCQDEVEQNGFVKSFRDPGRVDQRWVYVAGLGSAAACLIIWSILEKRR